MLRLWREPFRHEHIVEAVGIVIALHQTGDGITGRIGAAAALTEPPTEFVAVVLGDDVGLEVAAAVDVPTAHVLVVRARLVAHREVAEFTAVEVADDDITFCPFRVDVHRTGLGDMGITVLRQADVDIEIEKTGPGQKSCC